MLATLIVTAGLVIKPAASMDDLKPFHGAWRGTCAISPEHQGITSFGAELIVQPGEADDRLSWTIVYRLRETQTRAYELIAVDASKGHYVIDEKNGLMLDSYLAGGVLYSTFAIGQGVITASYQVLADGSMLMSLPQFDAQGVRQTCLSDDRSTCTNALGLISTQRCVLRRAEQAG